VVAGFNVKGEVTTSVWTSLLRDCSKCQIQVECVRLPVVEAGNIKALPAGFRVQLNLHQTWTQQFATLIHELGHLLCGHLGTGKRLISSATGELEAEAVAWLVCRLVNVWPASACYLPGYLKEADALPQYSLEAILVAAGVIENMIKGRTPERLKSNHS